MTIAKRQRPSRRQLGQFLTPPCVVEQMLADVEWRADLRVLEPSFGDGAFVLPALRRLVELQSGSRSKRLAKVLTENLHGVELDGKLYRRCLTSIEAEFGPLPPEYLLVRSDFFHYEFHSRLSLRESSARLAVRAAQKRRFRGAKGDYGDGGLMFDLVIGNPPFGGTFDAAIEDQLDRQYGERCGCKIKKETYAFFLVKCVERLKPGGRLLFVCSDSLLTIPTMKGLRVFLMSEGEVRIRHLPEFSAETDYPMVLLDFRRTGRSTSILRDGRPIARKTIELSANASWGMSDDLTAAFDGPTVGQFMIGTSGMTIGKNEYFVRPIVDGEIIEPYRFEFYQEPITLEGELARARLEQLSARQQEKIRQQERRGETRRCVRVIPRNRPLSIRLPHPDYKPYNKSNGKIVFSLPDHVIYWRNAGDAVLTFKKSGNWYLRGVGGQPFFEREGLTWQLVANRLKTRYLPAGSILDSGGPCGFLRPGVPHEELCFILAWTLSPLASRILKSVINHTMNIQSKDFERLPYPHWVSPQHKERAIRTIRELIERAKGGEGFWFDSPEIVELGALFDLWER